MTTVRRSVESLLHTENRLAAVRRAVDPLLRRLAERPETVGLGVLGGAARGGRREFVDEHSDVDLTLLVSVPSPVDVGALSWPEYVVAVQPWLPAWLPNFKFVDVTSGLEINIHQHVWEYEAQPHVRWDDEKCEAYAETLELVYDPRGHLVDLVAAKIADREDRGFAAALRLLTYGRNLAGDGVRKCLARGRVDAGVDIVTRLSAEVVECCFFVAGQWPPHPKWRLVMLASTVDDDPLRAEAYALATVRPTVDEDPVVACVRLRDRLVAVLDMLEHRCAQRWADWPADPYGYAVTRLFPDRQLRLVTAADAGVDPGTPYAARVGQALWNYRNTTLQGG